MHRKMLYHGGCVLRRHQRHWRNAGFPDHGRFGGTTSTAASSRSSSPITSPAGSARRRSADGVDSGANPLNPQSKISDVELIEMNYPMLMLARRHMPDSGGWGEHEAGAAIERLVMVYGSQDFTDNYGQWLPIPFARGLMGGYPGCVPDHFIVRTEGMRERLAESSYPSTYRDLRNGEYGGFEPQDRQFARIPVREYDIFVDAPVSYAGGGFGDPLDRNPQAVADDIRDDVISTKNAEVIYGVVITPDSGQVDQAGTDRRHATIREERLAAGGEQHRGRLTAHRRTARPGCASTIPSRLSTASREQARPLPPLRADELCSADENYKRFAIQRERWTTRA